MRPSNNIFEETDSSDSLQNLYGKRRLRDIDEFFKSSLVESLKHDS